MKLNSTPFFAVIFLLTAYSFQAQTHFTPDGGGQFVFNENKIPCLTDEQRTAVLNELKTSIQELKTQNRLSYNQANRGSHPLFIWPIKKKDGLEYNDVWGISNYVDQNPSYPNQVLDYNCGSRTYDTTGGYNHAGMDIFNWPFSWKMMDYDEVEIIAAAPGQILYKASSNFDRSCSLSGGNWNAVYVQHADGSVALYGHMKQNSLTTKNVGEMVAAGEFLGIVGSSGNSTGPHLHFEAYSEVELNGVGQDVLIDPYSGTCNSMNVDTWWQNQKPYNNPNINAVLTHSSPPVFPTCPTQETTNESTNFDASATVYFGLYMRDQASGTSINLKIIKPDNSVLYNWDFNFTDNYYASWWYWYFSGIYDMNGEWKWQATYQGQTVTHSFNITGALGIGEEEFNNTSIYPNPFNNVVSISSPLKIEKAIVVDMLGKQIKVISNNSEGIKEINLETLSNGIYFLNLESDSGQRKTIKIIKE
ncbi:peptidoglycan DD-metalloendopeptidase family protein [Subsaxibacter sp. CAU 1640]|uniref:peptidoglycan DD-metalloendopeptidase family protein n=1 Tax=Subsaxibacter sp. CAU 1640 TaxID=2933271 RepID=UPI00200414A5|nr:peptidoglycan DD-metalloendopeptidase family protein [Subsaxibacter sp. CAU 1640]MCK7589577.1 peptidoglycan DD-metalloendopeptidase family protein [Subsaxibacter sp. CAU 1640]